MSSWSFLGPRRAGVTQEGSTLPCLSLSTVGVPLRHSSPNQVFGAKLVGEASSSRSKEGGSSSPNSHFPFKGEKFPMQ